MRQNTFWLTLFFITVTNLFLSFQVLGLTIFSLAGCNSFLCSHKFILVVVLLKDKSGNDKIIVKKEPQLLNTNREFFPSFDASNFHKLVNESSKVRPNIVAILYFVRVCEGTIRRLAM